MSLNDAEKTVLNVIQEILREDRPDGSKIYEILNALHNFQLIRKERYGK